MGDSGRLLVVEHGRHAPAGLLADWAASRSLRVQTVALHAGEPLPATPDIAATVILGSELTAYDDTLPWLAGELAFLERMLAASVPVLGICFGAQALARVLGARGKPVPGRGGGAVAVVAPRRLRPAARCDGDRRQRRLRAGVLLRPARRRAISPGGDPGDRRVVGAAGHAAAGRRGDRAVVPRRGRRLAASGRARARAVLRLAGRRPELPQNGLTRLKESTPWKAPRPCLPPSTNRRAPNRPARPRASGMNMTGRCCAWSATSAGSSAPPATRGLAAPNSTG